MRIDSELKIVAIGEDDFIRLVLVIDLFWSELFDGTVDAVGERSTATMRVEGPIPE